MKKSIKIFFIVILSGVIVYNAYAAVNWLLNQNTIEEELAEINEDIVMEEIEEGDNINPPEDTNDHYWQYIKMPLINVDVEELKKTNSDTVGFLIVKGTNINYPVVQAKDNLFYINHSFKKEKNDAGWIFMDYRNHALNLGKNTIIYGHSRIDKSMFGTLRNILKTSWINHKDNYIVQLSTPRENTMWQVFSVYALPVTNYYITTDFPNDKQYEDWLNTMIGQSQHPFHTTINTDDKVLTLSTCYERGNSEKRVVMHAKLIKKA